jgi:hypothetical protein
MKKSSVVTVSLLLASLSASGQGTTTFLYDQQSSSNDGYYGYGIGPTYQEMLPNTGQSFTPSLAGIDFIRLSLADGNLTDGLGSTWFLNLRSTSITGPILGTTASVDLPDKFAGATDFFFPSTISLATGTVYFFDVNSADGGAWNIFISNFNYPGGIAWANDIPRNAADYWFREGIIVPEPSSAALLFVAMGSVWVLRRRIHR